VHFTNNDQSNLNDLHHFYVKQDSLTKACAVMLLIFFHKIFKQGSWASERYFPGGPMADFSKVTNNIFPGGQKVVEFHFAHSKLGKQYFFAKTLIG